MSVRTDFNSFADAVMERERDRLINSQGADPDEVTRLETLLGMPSSQYISEALSRELFAYSMLESAKAEVHRELQDDDSFDFLMGLSLLGLAALINKIKKAVEDANAAVAETTTVITSQPPTVTKTLDDKLEAVDKLLDDYAILKNASELLDDLSGVEQSDVNSFIATLQERLDELTGVAVGGVQEFYRGSGQGIRSTAQDRIVIVRELRDRYFEVVNERTFTPGVDGVDPTREFNFTLEMDSGTSSPTRILEIAGMDGAFVDFDGTITLNGDTQGISQNSSVVVQIVKRGTENLPQRSTNRRNDIRDSIVSQASTVEEALGFELWACLLLDLVDVLSKLWKKIKNQLDKALSVLEFKKNIINNGPFGKIPPLGTALLGNGAEIKKLLSAIKSPSDTAIDLLGVRTSFLNSGNLLSGNAIVCSQNHAHYCNISGELSDMIRDLFKNLDRFGMKLGNLKTPTWDQDALLDFLNGPFDALNGLVVKGNKFMENLEGEMCAVIERRMSSAPKALTGISAVLVAMIPFLTTLQPGLSPDFWGMQENPRFEEIADNLEKWGYLEAAAELRNGNPIELLKSTPKTTTASGKAAQLLNDSAKKAERKGEFQLAVQARLAAEAYEVHHTKLTMGGHMRELVANRYRDSQKLGLAVQDELKEYSDSVLEQMERERVL